MNSIFGDPLFPTPDPAGGHEGTRGGFDLPDGKKETPDTFGTRPTLTSVKDGSGGHGSSVIGEIGTHLPGSKF